MSRFKIEHGASKVNLVLLKTSIEDSIASDIDLLAHWSNNDRKYIVNELLRFALTQEEEFLKHKAALTATAAVRPSSGAKSAVAPSKPSSEPMSKPDAAISSATVHA
jgi:hypothetical protein